MYNLLGICLALTLLLAINSIASLAVAALWRSVANPSRKWPAAARARLLFALRMFPTTAAFVAVALFFIPSYLSYEPTRTGEVVTVKLGLLSILSAVAILLVIWRLVTSWNATHRLVANWRRHAKTIEIEGVSIPAYRVQHPFPVIAIVGVMRPRLFIAEQIFQSLNQDEIAAAILHEMGHLAARDNLKRWLICACRDLLAIVPAGRFLDREFIEATEAAADEFAARKGCSVALDLAAAIIRIARMVPNGARPSMPAGAFLVGERSGAIEGRVRRLTQIADEGNANNDKRAKLLNLITRCCLGASLAAVVFAAMTPSVLATLHRGIEQIVIALN
jgi:beta-lactamase regulating signal transducer with metallopeptidase domain